MMRKEWLLKGYEVAQRISSEANCERGSVGAVVLDGNGKILSYASNKRGTEGPCHCNDGADTNVTGSKTCQAAHAEVLAILRLEGEQQKQAHCLVTTRAPCQACMNMLLNTHIEVIATSNAFPDRDNSYARWMAAHRGWWDLGDSPKM